MLKPFNILCLLLLLLVCKPSNACICNESPLTRDILNNYKNIALVKIKALKNVSIDSGMMRNYQEAEVETLENFKGPLLTKILVTAVHSSCSMGVQENTYWIVFGNDWAGYTALFPCNYNVEFIGSQSSMYKSAWYTSSYGRGFGTLIFLRQVFNKQTENGTIEGKFLNGVNAYSAIYKNGLLEGKQIMYTPDGKKVLEANYVKGILNGEYATWYTNGQIHRRYHYQNKMLDGLYESWYINGQKESEVNYKNDKLHGSYKEWDKFGNLTQLTSYKNNLSIDTSFSWYPIDTSVAIASIDVLRLTDKVSIDSIIKWNARRQLDRLVVSDSVGNLLHLLAYYRNGNLERETNYEPNSKTYISHAYHFNGITSEIRVTIDGRSIFEEDCFGNDGKKIRKTFFDKNGKIIKVYELENGTNKLIFEKKEL